jgi:hypothetical protein
LAACLTVASFKFRQKWIRSSDYAKDPAKYSKATADKSIEPVLQNAAAARAVNTGLANYPPSLTTL